MGGDRLTVDEDAADEEDEDYDGNEKVTTDMIRKWIWRWSMEGDDLMMKRRCPMTGR